MREFQQKRKTRRILYSPLVLLVLAVFLALVARGTWEIFRKERESRRQLNRVEMELAALEARKVTLEERISELTTPDGVEAEIREQFQVAKPGERMVVIVEDEEAEPPEAPQKQSFVSRFFDIFR